MLATIPGKRPASVAHDLLKFRRCAESEAGPGGVDIDYQITSFVSGSEPSW